MTTFTQIDPNTLQIIGPVTADDTRAHRAFEGQGYGSWPAPGIGIVEEGKDLARCICGSCGNLTPPAEECQGCGSMEPEADTEPCFGEWAPCSLCNGTGRVDAPFAHFRIMLDASLFILLAKCEKGIDPMRVVPPPSGWFQPMSVRCGGAA